jgi:hypothetical protein
MNSMKTTYATATEAIERSISHNEITRCERTECNFEDLMFVSDNSNDGNDETEFWGEDDNGNTWRVHIAYEQSNRGE